MQKEVTPKQGKAGASGVDASEALAKSTGVAVEADYTEPETDDGGSLAVILSDNDRTETALALRELLGQVQEGFGDLTKPSDILAMDQPFYIVGATTIDDYLEKSTGELKVKHIYRLEFEGGVVRTMMQSTARPRRVVADAFALARRLSMNLRMGPYKLKSKKIEKQIQPALVFDQQPGFQSAIR